jgi:twitching motility protein PilT
MEGRDYEIRDTIEAGKEHYKSQTFDQALLDLYNDGIISRDQALENATSASDLELKMNGLMSGNVSEMTEENSMEKNINISSDDDDIFDLK